MRVALVALLLVGCASPATPGLCGEPAVALELEDREVAQRRSPVLAGPVAAWIEWDGEATRLVAYDGIRVHRHDGVLAMGASEDYVAWFAGAWGNASLHALEIATGTSRRVVEGAQSVAGVTVAGRHAVWAAWEAGPVTFHRVDLATGAREVLAAGSRDQPRGLWHTPEGWVLWSVHEGVSVHDPLRRNLTEFAHDVRVHGTRVAWTERDVENRATLVALDLATGLRDERVFHHPVGAPHALPCHVVWMDHHDPVANLWRVVAAPWGGLDAPVGGTDQVAALAGDGSQILVVDSQRASIMPLPRVPAPS